MHNVKQILRLIGATLCLFSSFTLPLLTCVQTATTHGETQATVTEVRLEQTTGRRGRINTKRTLRYRYRVDSTEYQGSDPNYEAGSSAKPGDLVKIMYRKGKPSDSRVSEYGMYGLKVTLIFLAVSGYLFFSFFRNRRPQ